MYVDSSTKSTKTLDQMAIIFESDTPIDTSNPPHQSAYQVIYGVSNTTTLVAPRECDYLFIDLSLGNTYYRSSIASIVTSTICLNLSSTCTGEGLKSIENKYISTLVTHYSQETHGHLMYFLSIAERTCPNLERVVFQSISDFNSFRLQTLLKAHSHLLFIYDGPTLN